MEAQREGPGEREGGRSSEGAGAIEHWTRKQGARLEGESNEQVSSHRPQRLMQPDISSAHRPRINCPGLHPDGPCQDRIREAAPNGGNRLSNQSHRQLKAASNQDSPAAGASLGRAPASIPEVCVHMRKGEKRTWGKILCTQWKQKKEKKKDGRWPSASIFIPHFHFHFQVPTHFPNCTTAAHGEGRPGPTWSARLAAAASAGSRPERSCTFGAFPDCVTTYLCT